MHFQLCAIQFSSTNNTSESINSYFWARCFHYYFYVEYKRVYICRQWFFNARVYHQYVLILWKIVNSSVDVLSVKAIYCKRYFRTNNKTKKKSLKSIETHKMNTEIVYNRNRSLGHSIHVSRKLFFLLFIWQFAALRLWTAHNSNDSSMLQQNSSYTHNVFFLFFSLRR